MSRTRTLDRLGLMGIASAIALSAAVAVGGVQPAWSAGQDQNQWQQHQGGGSGKQGQQQYRQSNNGQNRGSGQFMQNNTGQFTQNHNGYGQQWQYNNGQNGTVRNGQFVQNHNGNGQQWQYRNGQNGTIRHGQFTQNNNGQWWQNRNGQTNRYNGQFVQQNQWRNNNNRVRTANVTTRYDWHNYQPGHRPSDWDQRNHGVNFHYYQWNRTAQVRYHYAHPYFPPHGYYYRRWVYGQVFPTIFWTQNYWLTDYYSYGLDNPPYGYVWVRYGPDALLVNVYNGQILSVEYGVFYA